MAKWTRIKQGVNVTSNITEEFNIDSLGITAFKKSTDFTGLTFTAIEAGSTINMKLTMAGGTTTVNRDFSYSTDKFTWKTFTPNTSNDIILTNIGDKVYFKGNNPDGVSGYDNPTMFTYTFTMTGKISASGNVMSLVDDGECTTSTIPSNYCFYSLFKNCTALTTPPELPATSLTNYCYNSMFQGCTSLTTAPLLSALSAPEGCYGNMFQECSSLTLPPALPATTLGDYCYRCMFWSCTSLTSVPKLPATTLSYYGYSSMFWKCESLIISDNSESGCENEWLIPASGVFTNTYVQSSMFKECDGDRSSDNMPGATGKSYKYFTQNPPVA